MMLQERIAPVSIAKLPPPILTQPIEVDTTFLTTSPVDATDATLPSGDPLATEPVGTN